jgi:hypothetical protein
VTRKDFGDALKPRRSRALVDDLPVERLSNGMRASEVATFILDDVDWRSSSMLRQMRPSSRESA